MITVASYVDNDKRSIIHNDRFSIGEWRTITLLESGERIKNLFHFLIRQSLSSSSIVQTATDTGRTKEFFVESRKGLERIEVSKEDTTKEKKFVFGLLGNGINPVFQNANSKEETELKVNEYLMEKTKKDKGKSAGVVYINFTIDKQGKTTDISVLKGVNKTLDNLAIGYIEQMSEWTPGQIKGTNVLVTYTVAVKF
jgi:TonB family protein